MIGVGASMKDKFKKLGIVKSNSLKQFIELIQNEIVNNRVGNLRGSECEQLIYKYIKSLGIEMYHDFYRIKQGYSIYFFKWDKCYFLEITLPIKEFDKLGTIIKINDNLNLCEYRNLLGMVGENNLDSLGTEIYYFSIKLDNNELSNIKLSIWSNEKFILRIAYNINIGD